MALRRPARPHDPRGHTGRTEAFSRSLRAAQATTANSDDAPTTAIALVLAVMRYRASRARVGVRPAVDDEGDVRRRVDKEGVRGDLGLRSE